MDREGEKIIERDIEKEMKTDAKSAAQQMFNWMFTIYVIQTADSRGTMMMVIWLLCAITVMKGYIEVPISMI